MFRTIIRHLLEHKIKKYFRHHHPKLVVVTGSVGKTSTKTAIATVLAEKLRVSAQENNHNTDLSVPLSILGVTYPEDVHSLKAWWRVLRAMDVRIKEPTGVDVIVQELGTDTPGDIAHFRKYLKPDIAVVTAVSDEHMEFFKTIDAVAQEELSVAGFSQMSIINRDDIDGAYAKYAQTTNLYTYGIDPKAEYHLEIQPASPLDGRIGKLITSEWGDVPVTLQLVGDHSLKAAVAAACVAAKMGLSAHETAIGMSKIRAVKGRMRVLRGVNDSILIDDTYNASPLAVAAALQTLYAVDTPQRIAILGSMNELGETSQQAHATVGALCTPNKLEWLVTIGEQAEQYLAPAAVKNGCQVRSFRSPYEAGGFVNSVLREKGVVLAKGSQNGVFAEEALKVLIRNGEDEDQLVRQTEAWMLKKQEQFSAFAEPPAETA